MPPKGADEGAGFGLGSFSAGGFRRLRAAGYFAHGGKVTKTPPGTAPIALRAHSRLSPDPIYGGRQLGKLGSHRKGAVCSAEWFSVYYRCRFVVATSAQLRFRPTAKTPLVPLLLLSNANPLRWALRWGPPTAAFINEDWESKTSFITRAFCVGGAQVWLRGPAGGGGAPPPEPGGKEVPRRENPAAKKGASAKKPAVKKSAAKQAEDTEA